MKVINDGSTSCYILNINVLSRFLSLQRVCIVCCFVCNLECA